MTPPYTYKAEVTWTGEKIGSLSLEGKPDLTVATPPEFGGPEGLTSPEDLFVSAAAVCFMSTFLAMTQKVRARFEAFSCRGDGRLDLVADQGLVFTKLDLYPEVQVKGVEDVKRIEKALDLAGRYCLVTNSLKTEVTVHPEVKVV